VKTRPKFTSLEPLVDFLTFRVCKLCSENNNLYNKSQGNCLRFCLFCGF